MAYDKRLVKAFGIGGGLGITIGSIVTAVLLLGISLASLHPPTPKPTSTGKYVVVIVDDDKPTIQEGSVIDGPQMWALKAVKRAIVRSDTWKQLKAKGYDKLVTKAGGLPMVAILNEEGIDAYCGKLPETDAAMTALCLKYVTGLPPPAQGGLSSIVPIDPGGIGQVTIQDGVSVIDANGQRRALTSRPGDFRALAKYADSHPTFPPSEWKEFDRRPVFGAAEWIFDQGQHGSCVGQAGTAALEKIRWLCGMGFTKLSPTSLYGQINGGRDQGAVISDIIPALQNTGVCQFDLVPQSMIYPRQFPASWKKEAARFRLGEAYQVDSWNELVSALQTRRYIAVFGTMVGRNWTHFDRFGVAGHDPGPGNHALHADGVRKTGDGRVVLDTPNSWGFDWGPFKNGRVFLDERHLFSPGVMANVVVLRVPQDDPQDDGPPVYKGL